MRISLGPPRGRRAVLSVVAVVMTALTTYLLLDRNHAEEVGGGARIALDVVRGGQLPLLVLVIALAGAAAAARPAHRAAVDARTGRR